MQLSDGVSSLHLVNQERRQTLSVHDKERNGQKLGS